MSKNKIIKELHETTLISYKDCRETLKSCKWNFRVAYIKLYGGLDGDFILSLDAEKRAQIMNALTQAANSILKAFKELQEPLKAATESAAEFAQALAQGIKDGLDNPQSLEPWTAETSADILNGNEIEQIFIDEINEGGRGQCRNLKNIIG